jgi:hypothetical protein
MPSAARRSISAARDAAIRSFGLLSSPTRTCMSVRASPSEASSSRSVRPLWVLSSRIRIRPSATDAVDGSPPPCGKIAGLELEES